MANEELFRPRLAATTPGAAQADPDASLGGAWSSTPVAWHEGTITTVDNELLIRDSSLPNSLDLTGAWIYFLDTNLGEARQIADWVGIGRRMFLFEPLPSTPQVGDAIWIFIPNGLFSSYDATLCRERATRYRLCYALNATAGALTDVRAWVVDLTNGPLQCRVAVGGIANGQPATDFDVDDLPDEQSEPPRNADSGFTVAQGDGPQDFKASADWDRATFTPAAPPADRDIGLTNPQRPVWVELSFRTDVDGVTPPLPLPTQCAFLVLLDSNDGVTLSGFIVVVDVDGVPEFVETNVDRRLRIGGGARLSALVRDTDADGEPVPGRTIDIELASGPGSMNAQSATVQDGGVPVRRVYLAPTDPGQAGASVQFDFEVT